MNVPTLPPAAPAPPAATGRGSATGTDATRTGGFAGLLHGARTRVDVGPRHGASQRAAGAEVPEVRDLAAALASVLGWADTSGRHQLVDHEDVATEVPGSATTPAAELPVEDGHLVVGADGDRAVDPLDGLPAGAPPADAPDVEAAPAPAPPTSPPASPPASPLASAVAAAPVATADGPTEDVDASSADRPRPGAAAVGTPGAPATAAARAGTATPAEDAVEIAADLDPDRDVDAARALEELRPARGTSAGTRPASSAGPSTATSASANLTAGVPGTAAADVAAATRGADGAATSAAVLRVLDAIDALEHAPPPRVVVIESGEARLRVGLEAGLVRLTLLGDRTDAAEELLRETRDALDARGLAADVDARGGGQRGHDHPPDPGAGTRPGPASSPEGVRDRSAPRAGMQL